MKIYLLKNNVIDSVTLNKGIQMVIDIAATIGLKLEFTIENSTIKYTSSPFSNEVNPNGFIVNPSQIIKPIGYDIVCLIYDWSKITPTTN